MPPAAVIEINRAVVITKKMGVYRLSHIVNFIEKRASVGENVDERAVRIGADTYIKSAYLFFRLDVVGGEYYVIFSVLFDSGGRPYCAVRATVGAHIEDVVIHFEMLQIPRCYKI